MSDKAPEAEAREFAIAFRAFLDWINTAARGEERNEVVALVTDFLGADGAAHSVVTRELPPLEHVNLQTALDAWCGRPGRNVDTRGVAIPPHHQPPNLQQLLTGEAMGPARLAAPALADLPNGPGSTLGCLQLAVLLVSDPDGRYVVMVRAPSEHEHEPALNVEIAGLPVDVAQGVHARLAELRHQLN